MASCSSLCPALPYRCSRAPDRYQHTGNNVHATWKYGMLFLKRADDTHDTFPDSLERK